MVNSVIGWVLEKCAIVGKIPAPQAIFDPWLLHFKNLCELSLTLYTNEPYAISDLG